MKNLTIVFLSILLVVVNAATNKAQAKCELINLTCEYRINPIGIDIKSPRMSWQIKTNDTNIIQTAYEIRVAKSPLELKKSNTIIWTSGKVNSAQSVNVEYLGPQVESGKRYYWQVRIWNNKGETSSWSEPSFWEMGILSENEWKASWITMKEEVSDESLPAQYYRNEFNCSKKVKSARAYVTSLGLYQLFINGKKVGDQLFTPGFTSYKKRLQYQVYDVTSMLQVKNAIGAMVGDGWYRGNIGWEGDKAYYGDQLALLMQLEITYTDGSSEIIKTDQNWKVSYGAIQESDIYNGEKYDARKEMKGWANPGFDESNWEKVEILNHSKDILVASNSLPVRAIEELTPIEIFTTPKGELVLDLGQNMVGYVRMKVQGKKGDQVTLKFAEVLDKDGNFYTTNLRTADATDIYTLKGEEVEVYEPYFTFHGFRYVQLIGYPGELTKDKITGIVIHTDMKPTGTFTCSDSLINQLQKNIQWGQRDNFLDIPTDCPQRDERVGWTGDTQVFSMTAAFNYGVAPFYTKWLRDLAVDQQPNGMVPNIIPDMWNNKLGGCAGWADAALIVPWTVYRAYGDKRILEEQYESMKAWVEYVKKHAGNDFLWNEKRHQWGDWLSFHSDNSGYPGAYTEPDFIATAYFFYSTSILAKVAGILKNEVDATIYSELASKIKEAFIREFVTPNGRLVSHTQTAYAMALSFDLIPTDLRKQAADYFTNDIKKFGHLTSGFLGTPLLCSTLSSIGRDDLAFMLLNRKEFPSWLYPVTMGATTIWERWDTMKPDGTIIEGMNSFNHYAYGAIGEWLYTHVAGLKIDIENPGYKSILFDPHPGGGLTSAGVEFESMYGKIISSWEMKDDKFVYHISIPANSMGKVILPNAIGKSVSLNSKELSAEMVSQSGNNLILQVGSGNYIIEY